MMRLPYTRAAAAATLAVALGGAQVAHAQDWVIAEGAFETASDVTKHSRLATDRAGIMAALSGETPDYAEAMAIYASGRNFPWKGTTHSMGRFADDYNGDVAVALPRSVAHWGTSRFQTAPVFSALAGTDGMRAAPAEQRRALVSGATLATMLNWSRFELVMSRRKALAADPNWSLKKGSPKNWNEAFAFYHGPDGENAVHAALAGIDGGDAVNTALYEALAAGQDRLLEESWPAGHAAEAARTLDHAALLLFADALAEADGQTGPAREAALASAKGLWLAAAETVLGLSPGDVPAVEAALEDGDGGQIAAARVVVARGLDRLGG